MADTFIVQWESVFLFAVLIAGVGIWLRGKGYRDAAKIAFFIAVSTAVMGVVCMNILVPGDDQGRELQAKIGPLSHMLGIFALIFFLYALVTSNTKILSTMIIGATTGIVGVIIVGGLKDVFYVFFYTIVGNPFVLALVIAGCVGAMYMWKRGRHP